MAENSKIEWTDHTANFWWGCFKVSDGCKNCYADTLAHRYGKKIWGPVATTEREYKNAIWKNLTKWNRQAKEAGQRKRVFVMSMGDFFEDHPQVTEWRQDALALMQECHWLDFQVLTKRPENVIEMIEASRSHSFSDAEMWFYNYPHIWVGTSVENQEQADKRIPELLKIPARVRFLSCEPLLGAVDLSEWLLPIDKQPSHGILVTESLIDWVIAGGESGPNARPMHPDWARSLRDQCREAGVPFLFKQWGEWRHLQQFTTGELMKLSQSYPAHDWTANFHDISARVGKKVAGRLLDGREWNEFPTIEYA